MLENLFNNVFGRPKSKASSRNSQNEPSMSGPFSTTIPQMPQPPSMPNPPAPYPTSIGQFYPSLPFSQPPSMPSAYTGTLIAKQASPLDSVPFEARLSLNESTNLLSLDQIFRDIKKATDVVERADSYLKSDQSDYNFKIEQALIYQ